MIEKREDLMEIALRMEREAVEMYKELAETYRGTTAGTVFSRIALEEESHAGNIIKLLKTHSRESIRYEYPGEYEKYLQAIARFYMGSFCKKAKEEANITKLSDAIAFAGGMEMQSILFYQELQKILEDSKEVLEELISQEKEHLQELSHIKEEFMNV